MNFDPSHLQVGWTFSTNRCVAFCGTDEPFEQRAVEVEVIANDGVDLGVMDRGDLYMLAISPDLTDAILEVKDATGKVVWPEPEVVGANFAVGDTLEYEVNKVWYPFGPVIDIRRGNGSWRYWSPTGGYCVEGEAGLRRKEFPKPKPSDPVPISREAVEAMIEAFTFPTDRHCTAAAADALRKRLSGRMPSVVSIPVYQLRPERGIQMTDAELKEMQERCDKATKGPWFYAEDGAIVFSGTPHDAQHICDIRGFGAELPMDDNGQCIAHAREDMPRLLATVAEDKLLMLSSSNKIDELLATVAELRAEVEACWERIRTRDAHVDALQLEISELQTLAGPVWPGKNGEE